ncbi:DUF5994 family protein [Saccharopolyspora sp. K220]|nr:DUF5994 family protein [Saccharopolyspora soli]
MRWPHADPRELRVDGHQVRLEAFHTLDQHTVSMTSPNGRRMVLLVVPASGQDSVASPDDLLADDRTPGPTADTPIPQPAEASPEARWETDGGHLRTVR